MSVVAIVLTTETVINQIIRRRSRICYNQQRNVGELVLYSVIRITKITHSVCCYIAMSKDTRSEETSKFSGLGGWMYT